MGSSLRLTLFKTQQTVKRRLPPLVSSIPDYGPGGDVNRTSELVLALPKENLMLGGVGLGEKKPATQLAGSFMRRTKHGKAAPSSNLSQATQSPPFGSDGKFHYDQMTR